jgi:type IV pilus assembly protein PilX
MNSRHSQQGAALILSLILLLVLTLLGLSSMRTALLEERMAGNMRDLSLAFEAAEAGLREAELWLDQRPVEAALATEYFVYAPDTAPDLTDQTHTWWQNDEKTAAYGIADSNPLDEVRSQPRFVIEDRGFVKDDLDPANIAGIQFFRVTARGTGGTDTAQALTQNTYAKHN